LEWGSPPTAHECLGKPYYLSRRGLQNYPDLLARFRAARINFDKVVIDMVADDLCQSLSRKPALPIWSSRHADTQRSPTPPRSNMLASTGRTPSASATVLAWTERLSRERAARFNAETRFIAESE
jgi:hypothetical protein